MGFRMDGSDIRGFPLRNEKEWLLYNELGKNGCIVIAEDTIENMSDKDIGEYVRIATRKASILYLEGVVEYIIGDMSIDINRLQLKTQLETANRYKNDLERYKSDSTIILDALIRIDKAEKHIANIELSPKFLREDIRRRYGAIMKMLVNRDGYKCNYCSSIDQLEIDHVQAVSRGGNNSDNNLQLLCKICNMKKRDK